MNDKVIEFPKHKVVRDVPEEVIEERNRRADQKMADSIVDEITGFIITELDNYNVEVENKQFTKDFVLVADAIKACVYRSFALDHHLHEFVDNNVKLIEGDVTAMTKEEIKEKIEMIMNQLSDAKNNLDTDEEE
jgi:hypothetical protein